MYTWRYFLIRKSVGRTIDTLNAHYEKAIACLENIF